ncbi:MAG: hypothetical protein HY909_28225 [Deltaproteobacteria bacterium]|nr:hypothetical protein [Deltaproteobacteria bacterium]
MNPEDVLYPLQLCDAWVRNETSREAMLDAVDDPDPPSGTSAIEDAISGVFNLAVAGADADVPRAAAEVIDDLSHWVTHRMGRPGDESAFAVARAEVSQVVRIHVHSPSIEQLA